MPTPKLLPFFPADPESLRAEARRAGWLMQALVAAVLAGAILAAVLA